MPRVGVYCRISLDVEGSGAGVERQEQDCRAYCDERGYEVAEVYVDNDLSAYSGKRRPAYEQMLADLEAGQIDGVIVYHVDRLTRQTRELEHFIDLADRTKATLGTVTGDIDLSTSDGRFHARIMGAVAQKSSDDASRRLRRKWKANAEEGKPQGGGTRPYGYTEDKLDVIPAEADVVQGIVQMAFDGASLSGIKKTLNEKGVLNTNGNPWTSQTIKNLLVNPRYAGLRSYRGEIVGKGQWPAIISEEDHQKLLVILNNPQRRRKRENDSNALANPLSGFLTCGKCGKKLFTNIKTKSGVTRKVYECRGEDGCFRLSVDATKTEEVVRDRLAFLVSTQNEDVSAELEELADAYAELSDVEQRLERLNHAYYVEDAFSDAEYKKLRKELDAKKTGLLRSIAEAKMQTSLEGVEMTEDGFKAQWDEATVEFKRTIIEALLESVTILPTGKGGRFNPERVEIQPRFRDFGEYGIKARTT